jgi:hypothetical protein
MPVKEQQIFSAALFLTLTLPKVFDMKRGGLIIILLIIAVILFSDSAAAQCSICTKTASQLGEKPARALNGAIIYLMSTPLLIIGFIGWRWWKTQGKHEQ